MKRETLALWMFATSMIAWIIILAITPVGGWCESNPHHEDYKTAFAVTGIMVLVSIVFMMFNFNRIQKNDD
jgi:Na+/melibiose symporter-like transporter